MPLLQLPDCSQSSVVFEALEKENKGRVGGPF